MKITVMGNTVRVTSKIKLEDLNQVTRDGANMLRLDDAKGNAVYAVNVSKEGSGSITAAGVVFDYADAEGYASLNIIVSGTTASEETKAVLVKSSLGDAIAKFGEFEDGVIGCITSAKEHIDNFANSIETI